MHSELRSLTRRYFLLDLFSRQQSFRNIFEKNTTSLSLTIIVGTNCSIDLPISFSHLLQGRQRTKKFGQVSPGEILTLEKANYMLVAAPMNSRFDSVFIIYHLTLRLLFRHRAPFTYLHDVNRDSLRSCFMMFKNISKRIISEVKTENAVKILAVPKRPKTEMFKYWLKDKVNNFCKVTSLHGYVHTVNKEYNAFERYLWIILSFLALIAAIILLWISWNWNLETPTTTVIESTNYPTYNLPFPSVTICNMNKISKSTALEIANDM